MKISDLKHTDILNIVIVVILIIIFGLVAGIAFTHNTRVESENIFFGSCGSQHFQNTWSMIEAYCQMVNCEKIYLFSQHASVCEIYPFDLNYDLKIALGLFVSIVTVLIFWKIIRALKSADPNVHWIALYYIKISALIFGLYISWVRSKHGQLAYTDNISGHIQGYVSNGSVFPGTNLTFTNGNTFAKFYCELNMIRPNVPDYLIISNITKCGSVINTDPILFEIFIVFYLVVELILYICKSKKEPEPEPEPEELKLIN